MTSPPPPLAVTDLSPARAAPARGSAWRARVLALLVTFPDGTTIAHLVRPLADGTRGYDSAYRRIWGTLRACERDGQAERAGHQHARVPVAWSLDSLTRSGGQLPVIWKATRAGTEYAASLRGDRPAVSA